jgi:hypothetical protein
MSSEPPSRTFLEVNDADWPALKAALPAEFPDEYDPPTLENGRRLVKLRGLPTEIIDLGSGETMERPIVPAAAKAASQTVWRGWHRLLTKRTAENTFARYTKLQIYNAAVAAGADMTGINASSPKREILARWLSATHPNWGPIAEKLTTLEARIDAATPGQIARWAWERGVDVTDCADKAAVKTRLAVELAYSA